MQHGIRSEWLKLEVRITKTSQQFASRNCVLVLAACMSMDAPKRCNLTGLHSKVNTLTETVRKPSLATRLRDLVAGDSGFTLLETLAVMVIVGLLAAITVPQIAKWRDKAYITALKTDARNIANAVEASPTSTTKITRHGQNMPLFSPRT